jgi:peroxiredoxin
MTEVEMKNIDGERLTIAGVAGKKGTLVVFTCNSCPWVKAWEERMVDLGNEYSKQGIGVVFVNSNDPAVKPADDFEPMQTRAKQRGMKFAYAVDATSDIARAFGATRTPEAYLFDADGKLVYHGAIDDNAHKPAEVSKHYLGDALQAVVAGEEIAMATTKALGCSIKFRTAKGDKTEKKSST